MSFWRVQAPSGVMYPVWGVIFKEDIDIQRNKEAIHEGDYHPKDCLKELRIFIPEKKIIREHTVAVFKGRKRLHLETGWVHGTFANDLLVKSERTYYSQLLLPPTGGR